jgi:transposase
MPTDDSYTGFCHIPTYDYPQTESGTGDNDQNTEQLLKKLEDFILLFTIVQEYPEYVNEIKKLIAELRRREQEIRGKDENIETMHVQQDSLMEEPERVR